MFITALLVNSLTIALQAYVLFTGRGWLVGAAITILGGFALSVIANAGMALIASILVGVTAKAAPYKQYERILLRASLYGLAAEISFILILLLWSLSHGAATANGLH